MITLFFFQWEIDHDSNFDIYPLRGSIEKEQSVMCYIKFCSINSNGNVSDFSANAICRVKGGPDYPIKLTGSSSEFKFSLTPTLFNFPNSYYYETVDACSTLSNESHVEITFKVSLPKSCSFLHIKVDKSEGKIPPGESIPFRFSILPGYVKKFNEMISIYLGGYQEIKVQFNVETFLPFLEIPLQRIDRSFKFNQYIDDKKASYPTLSPIDNRRLTGLTNFQGFVSSQFIVNFEQIIFGDVLTKTITVQQNSISSINLFIFASALNNTGFSISYPTFGKLKPNCTIDLTITFDPNEKKDQELGQIEKEIFLAFNRNVADSIVVKAFLIMPQLIFSQTIFDFETVLIGQSHSQTLQVQNSNLVPVEFFIQISENIDPTLSSNSIESIKDETFVAFPSTGIIQPHSFQNIEITFSPLLDKKYSKQFPFVIRHASDIHLLTLKGIGFSRVQFDPPEVVFPPVLPYQELSTFPCTLR